MAAAPYSYANKVPIALYDGSDAFKALIGKYKNVIVLGDTVPKFAGETERIGGADRAEVAAKWSDKKCPSWKTVYICSGSKYPDGIAAAQMVGNAPLLYAGWGATIDALKRHAGEIKELVIFGGYDSVDEAERKAVCNAAGIG